MAQLAIDKFLRKGKYTMTKLQLNKVTILKDELPGYSSSLQDVIKQTTGWKESLKFSRIVREIQPILKDFDEDRNLIINSVEIKEEDSEPVKRQKAKIASERLQELFKESVEVFEINISDLQKVYPDKVKTEILIGFGEALNFDVDLEENNKEGGK